MKTLKIIIGLLASTAAVLLVLWVLTIIDAATAREGLVKATVVAAIAAGLAGVLQVLGSTKD